jgi:hypothetical protein
LGAALVHAALGVPAFSATLIETVYHYAIAEASDVKLTHGEVGCSSTLEAASICCPPVIAASFHNLDPQVELCAASRPAEAYCVPSSR